MIGMPCRRQLRLRIVRIKVEIPGFRVHQYDLVTTLTDADIYTKDELAELCFRRWTVELFFRQIKTTIKSCAAELPKWLAKNCGCA